VRNVWSADSAEVRTVKETPMGAEKADKHNRYSIQNIEVQCARDTFSVCLSDLESPTFVSDESSIPKISQQHYDNLAEFTSLRKAITIIQQATTL
jgi:hypothetical protein